MAKITLDFTDEDARLLRERLGNRWATLPEAELEQLIRAEVWRAATEEQIAAAKGEPREPDLIQASLTHAIKRWGGLG